MKVDKNILEVLEDENWNGLDTLQEWEKIEFRKWLWNGMLKAEGGEENHRKMDGWNQGEYE